MVNDKTHPGYAGRPEHQDGNLSLVGGMSFSALDTEFEVRNREALEATHSIQDVILGNVPIGVEGHTEFDIEVVHTAGLYTKTIGDRTVFSRTEEEAEPVIGYLQEGGKYGTPEFSRLLGYTESEIANYTRFLEVQNELLKRTRQMFSTRRRQIRNRKMKLGKSDK